MLDVLQFPRIATAHDPIIQCEHELSRQIELLITITMGLAYSVEDGDPDVFRGLPLRLVKSTSEAEQIRPAANAFHNHRISIATEFLVEGRRMFGHIRPRRLSVTAKIPQQ